MKFQNFLPEFTCLIPLRKRDILQTGQRNLFERFFDISSTVLASGENNHSGSIENNQF